MTGGASGLGLATARRLSADGAAVVVLDLERSRGAAVVDELGPRATFIPGDVTERDDVHAAVLAAGEMAPVRIAVAAAGSGPPSRLFDRSGVRSFDAVRATLSVNVLGTLHLLAHAGYAMSANEPQDGERGVVVCTSSIAAYDGQAGHVAYAASKGAVASLTLPAARELARNGIRLVSVAPGLFDTPLLAGMPEEARRTVVEQIPHPARLGRPESTPRSWCTCWRTRC